MHIKEQDLAAIMDIVKGFYALDTIPSYLKELLPLVAKELKDTNTNKCSRCKKVMRGGDLEITNCGHFYCKHCLLTLKNPINKMGKINGMWDCTVCKAHWPYFGN